MGIKIILMLTTSSFKCIKNKHGVYRGKDCMKKFCESLGEHAMEKKKKKIIKFKKKIIKLVAIKQQE